MKARADMTDVIHDSDATFDPVWLRGLCDRAQEWVKETGGLECFVEAMGRRGGPKTMLAGGVPTNAYVDLMFAFGLAILGAKESAQELLNRGTALLQDRPEGLHACLLWAFRERIGQALEGKRYAGHLSEPLQIWMKRLDFGEPYAVERLRERLRILEPDVRIDSYYRYMAHLTE